MASKAVPFPLVRGSYHIDLFYFPDFSAWAICQKKGRKWFFFHPQKQGIWDKEYALTDPDPYKLLQIFVLALGSLDKKHELAAFIRNRYEAYEKLFTIFLPEEKTKYDNLYQEGTENSEKNLEENEENKKGEFL